MRRPPPVHTTSVHHWFIGLRVAGNPKAVEFPCHSDATFWPPVSSPGASGWSSFPSSGGFREARNNPALPRRGRPAGQSRRPAVSVGPTTSLSFRGLRPDMSRCWRPRNLRTSRCTPAFRPPRLPSNYSNRRSSLNSEVRHLQMPTGTPATHSRPSVKLIQRRPCVVGPTVDGAPKLGHTVRRRAPMATLAGGGT